MVQMNVLLADDHPIVLMGVREIIERDPRFKVVGEALNSSELISKVALLRPDVIITDYNMPVTNSTATVRAWWNTCGVIFLSRGC